MKLKQFNAAIIIMYVYLPMYFIFISEKLGSYIYEYIMTAILLILSLLVNLKEGIKIKKISIILLIYILIHIFRDFIFNNIFYFQIYKKIFYNGILAIYFFNLPFDYKYMKKFFYKINTLYFYIFIFQFLLFYNEYLEYMIYMTIGFHLLLPTSFFLFSFILSKEKQWKDLIYGLILFFILFKYGNRSSSFIILVVFFIVIILKKGIVTQKIKVFLSIGVLIIFKNLKNIVYLLNNISLFQDSRIIKKFIEYYENIGTGILSGRDVIIENYIIEIKNNLILGNLITNNSINIGNYSHNIFIDIVYHNGIILGIIFVVLICIIIIRTKKNILIITFLCTFSYLFFSSYYLFNRGFYITIILGYLGLKNKKIS